MSLVYFIDMKSENFALNDRANMKVTKSFSQKKLIVVDKVNEQYIVSVVYYKDISDNLISEMENRLTIYADIFAAFINSLPLETPFEEYENITFNFKSVIQKYDVKAVQVDTKHIKSDLGSTFITYIAVGRVSTFGNNCYVFQPILQERM